MLPVHSEQDTARYADLNQAVTREGDIAIRLIRHRPGSHPHDFLMMAEKATGRIVSTTCLLRWQASFEGVDLDVAMLEMVVTDPGFRHQGLVRAQIEAFHDRACTEGADFCIIQGIPYYYRQFGYAYALDHFRQVAIPAPSIPDGPRDLRSRPFDRGDLPDLVALYELEMSRQGFSVRRTEADWDYLITHAGMSVEMIEVAGQRGAAGYLCCREEQGDLKVAESGLRHPAQAPAALALLAQRRPATIVVCGNRVHPLARTAEELGGRVELTGQWLVRVADPVRLVARLAPVLERRLQRAAIAPADAEVTINLYRSALRISLKGGRVSGVERAGFIDSSLGADGGDLCIPPEAFVRLLFGYRSLDQLLDAWPDIVIRPKSRQLLEALFPGVQSLVLMPY